jgi:two-component system nitrogen regulation sensor histidine kinase GlnL
MSDMSMNKPGEPDPSQSGLSFANALRDCFVAGLIVVDPHQRLAILTPAARQLLGADAHPGAPAPLDTLPAPLSRITAEALAGDPSGGLNLDLTHPIRGAITLRVSAFALKIDGQRPLVALLLNDLTSAMQFEQHLRQLDRLSNMGTLAASMAHEIKNALVAGRTFIDLLLEKHQDAELVEIVRREMGRIDAIVSRMLNFSGPGRSAFGVVHLHEILDHSLRLVQPQRESRSIRLERSFQAASDAAQGDEHQLQQAFVNLLLNALEAMGPEGTLTVATEILDGLPDSGERPRLCVAIKDTGAGILPEHLPRLFEPFFTTKPAGTGIGLVVTQRILHEHRGAIVVESQPGRGTTFRVTLPTARENPPA